MSLITQVMVAERYGLRLDMAQLAEVLGVEKTTSTTRSQQARAW